MPQRHRQNFIGGLIEDNPLASGATTITSAALAAVDEVVLGTTYIPIVLDPDGIGGAPEIAYITAHTTAATTATVSRAEESTAAREHKQDIRWVHGPTVKDFTPTLAVMALSVDATGFPSAVESQIPLNTAAIDPDGICNVANNTITVPADGFYEVAATVAFRGHIGGSVKAIGIAIDGGASLNRIQFREDNTSNSGGTLAGRVVQLSAGDEIELNFRAQEASSGSLQIDGAIDSTWLSLKEVRLSP